MAYTIISQNNNTTTLTDGINTITVPSRVNLTSGNFTIVEVNNNMATLQDGDGNVYRDVPCVATLVDAGGPGLPDQTGHSGEFLTTDGTDASWSDKPLVNTATGTNSVSVLSVASGQSSVVIGYGVGAGRNSVSIGSTGNTSTNNGAYAIAIGTNAITTGSYALGPRIAIGNNVTSAASRAIQLGFNGTNPDANTFKVANANGNYEIMSADGTIPADRLASTTGLADGNYRLRLTMTDGVPTLSWVAE